MREVCTTNNFTNPTESMESIKSLIPPYLIPYIYATCFGLILFQFLNLFTPATITLDHHEGLNKLNLIDSHPNKSLKSFLTQCKPFPLKNWLIENSPTISQLKKIFPTFWLKSGHLMTAYFKFIEPDEKMVYEREMIQFEDGGQVALDWNSTPDESSNTPIVVMLHGLSGGSREPYIQSLVKYLSNKPNYFDCVVMNLRGCGLSELTSPNFYNAGYIGDLEYILKYLHTKYPNAPLYGVGFSMGANLLTKYLGESGDNCYLSGAFVVCNPFDILNCNRMMEQSFLGRTIYSPALLNGLASYYNRHKIHFDKVIQPTKPWKVMKDFDGDITAKVFGYQTANEYYRENSSDRWVQQIKRPTLFLSAFDDPICHSSSIPIDEIKCNPYLLMATSSHGGHLGFWEGFLKPKHYFITMIAEYFDSLQKAYDLIESGINQNE